MVDKWGRRTAGLRGALVSTAWLAIFAGTTSVPVPAQPGELEPTAVGSTPARYGLQPGLELLFTAAMEMTITGPYSEQSNRAFETRFVVMNENQAGNWEIMGVSKLAKRIMDGEELPDPFGTPEAYLFEMDDYGRFRGYKGEEPQFGTAWTPMIHFPPLPAGGVPSESRSTRPLPVYIGLGEDLQGWYSFRWLPAGDAFSQYGAMMQYPVQARDIPVTISYQEHEMRFDLRKRLPASSRSSYQIQMNTPIGGLDVELQVENQLNQANLYPSDVMKPLVNEITRYFALRNPLQALNIEKMKKEDVEKKLEDMITFSRTSRVPFLRDAAGSVIVHTRYRMRLNENFQKVARLTPAPPFRRLSVQNQPIQVPSPAAKPVVVLFWALWWGPSEQALWDMETFRKANAGQEVEYVAVNLDRMESFAQNYVLKSGIQIPVIWDNGYPDSGIAMEYGVRRIPEIVVIDRLGRISGRDVQPEQLAAMLERLTRKEEYPEIRKGIR
ncbi:MAG TPA: TlpA disulfide reductase family protein [bacterium]|nr:TlpA disulfide reductase family protein [bacterium]